MQFPLTQLPDLARSSAPLRVDAVESGLILDTRSFASFSFCSHTINPTHSQSLVTTTNNQIDEPSTIYQSTNNLTLKISTKTIKMRSTLILAALSAVALADTWSYTGPSYTMTADVWTSSCTDNASPIASTWVDWTSSKPAAVTVTSGSSKWTTYAAASSTPAVVSASSAGWGSYSAPAAGWGSSAAPAATSVAVVSYSASGVSPAQYTGAAAHNVVGAGALAAAGLAMLL